MMKTISIIMKRCKNNLNLKKIKRRNKIKINNISKKKSKNIIKIIKINNSIKKMKKIGKMMMMMKENGQLIVMKKMKIFIFNLKSKFIKMKIEKKMMMKNGLATMKTIYIKITINNKKIRRTQKIKKIIKITKIMEI